MKDTELSTNSSGAPIQNNRQIHYVNWLQTRPWNTTENAITKMTMNSLSLLEMQHNPICTTVWHMMYIIVSAEVTGYQGNIII